jgi:hypothetical protein
MEVMQMADIIQLRRDSAANWTSANPTLAQGEMGIETDTLKLKIGDGTTAWTSLAYYQTASTAGTVESVALSVPTGLEVSGSPITTTGTFTVTYAAGYSIPTTAKQGDWDTAYGWGNHASVGYLTTESDPIFVGSDVYGVTSADISNWDTAYSWGNHASAGYLDSGDIGVTVLAYDSNLSSFVSTFTLPTADSTANYVLATDGAGNLSFIAQSGGMANPMTTLGDVIVGGASGAPNRLPVGATGQVLTVVGGEPEWANSTSGFSNPMTTEGDIIIGDTGGTAIRLPAGTDGQVLTLASGVPTWDTPSPAGLPSLAGNEGKVLAVNATEDGVEWVTPTGGGGEAFPVGAVYISVTGTNPSTELGYGTWSSFGAGRVLVGFDSTQTEFDTVEETGGAKTVTLPEDEMPSHTHIQNSHTHTATNGLNTISNTTTTTLGAVRVTGASSTTSGATTATNQNTGGGQPHNNLQPYIVVYMWKRTA